MDTEKHCYSPATARHCSHVIKGITEKLNRGQIPVTTADQPSPMKVSRVVRKRNLDDGTSSYYRNSYGTSSYKVQKLVLQEELIALWKGNMSNELVTLIKWPLSLWSKWLGKPINRRSTPIGQGMRNGQTKCQRYLRLVIFPMSGNNTFETSNFADLHFSFWSSEGVPLSPTVFLRSKLLRNMKRMILCFVTKEFAFSCLLTGEKSKSK